MWITLVIIYGLFKGIRDVTKKKAMQISSTIEVLFVYTLLSFVMSAFLSFFSGEASPLETDFSRLWIIGVKSSVIFIAWICSFKAIKKLPIGFYGIMDMSRVIIAAILSVLFLHEAPTSFKLIGMALVLAGLLLVNLKNDSEGGRKANTVYILMVLVSCLMNAVSEILDKYLMGGSELTSGQLQFWYMLFLVVLYLGYMLVSKTKIDWKKIFKNYWLIVMSVLFVFGDKALFEACKYEDSSVITMTLIKQCSVLITIIGGRVVFKEKHTLYKLMCAAVIITGIVISVIPAAV
ncbi:MAG: DMT family transporter [Oscillospiraceae bacterium]|nr:DMT family transporter [Oscillospiraceae bacterium]